MPSAVIRLPRSAAAWCNRLYQLAACSTTWAIDSGQLNETVILGSSHPAFAARHCHVSSFRPGSCLLPNAGIMHESNSWLAITRAMSSTGAGGEVEAAERREEEMGEERGGVGREGDGGRADSVADEQQLSSGLPLLERCKNLLVSNWMGQLTTFKAGSSKIDSSSFHSSLVRFLLLPAGTPLLLLSPDDPHTTNLMLEDRVSLMVGASYPAPLIAALQRTKRSPPRTVLIGEAVAVEPTELPYVHRRVLAASEAAARQDTKSTSPSPSEHSASLPTSSLHSSSLSSSSSSSSPSPPSPPLPPPSDPPLSSISFSAERAAALRQLSLDASSCSLFRLLPRAVHFVDSSNRRQPVEAEGIAGAAVDPLATSAALLCCSLNASPHWRDTFVLFCAAYMGVECQDALMTSVDRYGFSLFGQVEETGELPWREFRFTFRSEVRSTRAFLALLQDMESEMMKDQEIAS